MFSPLLLLFDVGCVFDATCLDNGEDFVAQGSRCDILADDCDVGVAYLLLYNRTRQQLETEIVPVAFVEVVGRGYDVDISITQGDGAIGVTLYRYAVCVLQYVAGKHSPSDLIDEDIVAKGLTLLDKGKRD